MVNYYKLGIVIFIATMPILGVLTGILGIASWNARRLAKLRTDVTKLYTAVEEHNTRISTIERFSAPVPRSKGQGDKA